MPDQHCSRFHRLVLAPAILNPAEALEAAIQLVTRAPRPPRWITGLGRGHALRVQIRVLTVELQQDLWPRDLFRSYLRVLERGWIALPSNPN